LEPFLRYFFLLAISKTGICAGFWRLQPVEVIFEMASTKNQHGGWFFYHGQRSNSRKSGEAARYSQQEPFLK
jgi:hypothetical protein